MGDLISREALLEEIKKDLKEKDTSGNTAPFITGLIYRQFDIEKIIEEQPQVEAVPVVHGKWKMRGGRLYCTNCEKKALEEKDRDDWYGCIGSNFCPNCGADMRTSAE